MRMTSSSNPLGNDFAFKYYFKQKINPGNIFFSPFSISSALAIVHEGAKGKTSKEIQELFHFPLNDDIKAIITTTQKAINYANAIWVQKDYTVLTDFVQMVKDKFAAEIHNIDIKSNPEAARIMINQWIQKQTADKIIDLISPSHLDPYTKLVITNAIYFKEKWTTQFNQSETKVDNFFTGGENPVKVEMMSRTGSKDTFEYMENDYMQMLELPYIGGKLSMLVILPKSNNIAELENSLTITNFDKWRNELKPQRVKVYIPKFRYQSTSSLREDLKSMGMPTAFSWPGADFSGIDGTNMLCISEVIHSAFIEVNEEGTEASAATAVVERLGASFAEAPARPIFKADHPFVFLIKDENTGSILFMGRMTNPAQ